jgi:hypothetical protein
MWLFAVSVAAAGPIFLAADDAVELDVSGNWPRAFPAADGWWVTNAAAGTYNVQHVRDDLSTDTPTRKVLTDVAGLQDHAISACPDGTYLHFATASLREPNDSAYVFHYDADFDLLDEAVIAEGDTTGTYVDIPSICAEDFRGMAYWADDDAVPFRYVGVDDALAPMPPADLATGIAMGSVMFEDEGQLNVLSFNGKTGDSLLVSTFDRDLQPVAQHEVDVSPDGWTSYWSQGAARVGNVYLVVHMESDDAYTWDTLGGDLFVEAFTLDWEPIDSLQLSHNTAPIGGMQPGLAVKGDTLLVLYSLDLHNIAYRVTLDLAAADRGGASDTGGTDTGGDTDTDGGTDSGTTGDTDDTDAADTDPSGDDVGDDSGAPDDSGAGCGCVGAPGGGGFGGLGAALGALAMAAGRRRSRGGAP